MYNVLELGLGLGFVSTNSSWRSRRENGKLCPLDIDVKAVHSDLETLVSESFYGMYDDQEETDQSESTDDVDDK